MTTRRCLLRVVNFFDAVEAVKLHYISRQQGGIANFLTAQQLGAPVARRPKRQAIGGGAAVGRERHACMGCELPAPGTSALIMITMAWGGRWRGEDGCGVQQQRWGQRGPLRSQPARVVESTMVTWQTMYMMPSSTVPDIWLKATGGAGSGRQPSSPGAHDVMLA